MKSTKAEQSDETMAYQAFYLKQFMQYLTGFRDRS